MPRRNIFCQYVDFSPGSITAPLSNALRSSPAWHSLTYCQQAAYIEILAEYFKLARPKMPFRCSHSTIKGKISKSSWFTSVEVLNSAGFIEIVKGDRYNLYRLSNKWKGKAGA